MIGTTVMYEALFWVFGYGKKLPSHYSGIGPKGLRSVCRGSRLVWASSKVVKRRLDEDSKISNWVNQWHETSLDMWVVSSVVKKKTFFVFLFFYQDKKPFFSVFFFVFYLFFFSFFSFFIFFIGFHRADYVLAPKIITLYTPEHINYQR